MGTAVFRMVWTHHADGVNKMTSDFHQQNLAVLE